MKLISCYIENFGGLSQYSLDFHPGITAIEEPNGFGKTTLAEFIRAMFYGLPRKSKNLQKDIRTRYMPWQGGKFGGNLIFEHNGTTYKIERSFGAVPRQDSFQLYNQDTHRKSTDFTENIGTELFQLDADSFERSTYMPQMRDIDSLTTDNIQAKLGNLVEDTNDINNFEKAIAALKAQRSTLIPYRGDGGAVAKAQQQISQLQHALSERAPLPEQLDQALEALSEKKEKLKTSSAALDRVRNEITSASEAAAREAIAGQYQSLLNRETETKSKCTRLQSKYPQGLPSLEELNQAEALLTENLSLASQEPESQAYLDAADFVKQNQHRFKDGLPSFSELQQHLSQSRSFMDLESTSQHAGLSQLDLNDLESLNRFFAPGVPDGDTLDNLTQQEQKLQQLKVQQEMLNLPKTDLEKLQALEHFFAPGIPTQEQMKTCRQKAALAGSLRRQNAELASIAPFQADAPEEKKSSPAVPLLIFGLALVLGGLVCLLRQMYVPGAVCSVLGLSLCITGLYLKLKQSLSREVNAARQSGNYASPVQQDQIRRNDRTASSLEEEVRKITDNYIPGGDNLSEMLVEIQSKADAYSVLRQQYDTASQRLCAVSQDISQLEQSLTQSLQPYFQVLSSFSECISILREKASQHAALSEKKRQADRHIQEINAQLSQLRSSLEAFLAAYSENTDPQHFTDSLYHLQRDCTAYLNAEKLLEEQRKKQLHRRDALKHNEDELDAFREKYGLLLCPENRQELHTLREDISALRDLNAQFVQDHSAVILFYEEHQQVLDTPVSEKNWDSEALRQEEQSLTAVISQLSEEITQEEQTVRQLRQSVEEIPKQEDALLEYRNEMAQAQKKAQLLDQTMEFLEKARDGLSSHYLGDIRKSFSKYMSLLSQEDGNSLSVNPDLDVKLERMGQARDLAYFSAGQADLVVLCMRLALVDTLFEDSRPILILDDPFVNLDDEHTEKALNLLRQLENDHQILYLFCNSSRKIP